MRYTSVVLLAVAMSTACNKSDKDVVDPVFDDETVDTTTTTPSGGETEDDSMSDETKVSLSSVAFVASTYSDIGLPIFRSSSMKYVLSGATSVESAKTTTTSFQYRLNPTNADVSGITWKLMRRAATITRAEGDDYCESEDIDAVFSVDKGVLGVEITGDVSDFLEKAYEDSNVTDTYTYAIVAEYADGSQIVSDFALYGGESGDTDQISVTAYLSMDEGATAFTGGYYVINAVPYSVVLPEIYGYVGEVGNDVKLLSEFGFFPSTYVYVTEVEEYDHEMFEYKEGQITCDTFGESVYTYALLLAIYNNESMVTYTDTATLSYTTIKDNVEKEAIAVDKDEDDKIKYYEDTKDVSVSYDMKDDVKDLSGYSDGAGFVSGGYTPTIEYNGKVLVVGTHFKIVWEGWTYTITFIGDYEYLNSGTHYFYVYFRHISYTYYYRYYHSVVIYAAPVIVLPTMIEDCSTYGTGAKSARVMSVPVSKLIEEYATTYSDGNLTFKLAVNSNAKLSIGEESFETITGTMDELASYRNHYNVVLGKISTSTADVSLTFTSFRQGVLVNTTSTEVEFKNPLEMKVKYGFEIGTTATSECDLTENLELYFRSDYGSNNLIYSKKELSEGYGITGPTMSLSTENESVKISGTSLVVDNGKSLSEKDVVKVDIKFSSDYAVVTASECEVTAVSSKEQ
ncbi:MAG: hypothetical protein SNG73_02465 [Rikenellaceae bacterium]